MTITIPPGAANYIGPISPVICSYRATPQPVNMDQAIPLSIAWGNSGGTGIVAPAVSVNIEAQATSTPIGRIMSMFVDNSECGVAVRFIFPETQWQLIVDAGAQGVFPILALGVSFYVAAEGAGSADVTNFTPFNFPVAPVALPETQQANVAVSGVLEVNNGSGGILANTISGTIEGLNVQVTGVAGSGTGSQVTISLIDGTGKVIWQGYVLQPSVSTAPYTGVLIDQSGMNLRFQDGLTMSCVVTGGGFDSGIAAATVYYH